MLQLQITWKWIANSQATQFEPLKLKLIIFHLNGIFIDCIRFSHSTRLYHLRDFVPVSRITLAHFDDVALFSVWRYEIITEKTQKTIIVYEIYSTSIRFSSHTEKQTMNGFPNTDCLCILTIRGVSFIMLVRTSSPSQNGIFFILFRPSAHRSGQHWKNSEARYSILCVFYAHTTISSSLFSAAELDKNTQLCVFDDKACVRKGCSKYYAISN